MSTDSMRPDNRGEARIALPWPPSTNGLFVNARGGRGGRFTSKEYAAWQKEAGWTLQAQRPPKFRGPVVVAIELCPPHARRFDLDNRNKAVLDLLVTHQVLPDDHDGFVREVNVRRVQTGAPCTVIVRAA